MAKGGEGVFPFFEQPYGSSYYTQTKAPPHSNFSRTLLDSNAAGKAMPYNYFKANDPETQHYSFKNPQQQQQVPWFAKLFNQVGQAPVGGTNSGGGSSNSFALGGASPSPVSYEDRWSSTNDWQNGGKVPAWIPGAGIANTVGDINHGINPTYDVYGLGNEGIGNKYFNTYEGPGNVTPSYYGIEASEQRDMLIDQELGFWDSPQEEQAWVDTSSVAPSYTESTSYDDGGNYSDWSDSSDFSNDTGIGDSDFDTSHSDFSWDDNQSDDSGGGDSGGGGGGSYIATAATKSLGEDSLNEFDDWRDHMAEVLPTFKTTYGRYRVTAPKIVIAIDSLDNSDSIYAEIWTVFLRPILNMIRAKDDAGALGLYRVMVKKLKETYYDK